MLKRSSYLILVYALVVSLYSCAGGSNAYHLDASEKEKQRGFHANEANKIIDKNKQNKNANAKNAEKNRQQTNSDAADKAKKKSSKKNQDKFSFY